MGLSHILAIGVIWLVGSNMRTQVIMYKSERGLSYSYIGL